MSQYFPCVNWLPLGRDADQRVIKRGPQGETAYVNQFWTVRNREVGTKHVFAGGTRMVSKLVQMPREG